MLADGSVRTLDGGDELLAARVSLGALGVIAAVTLRCVPAFRLRHTDKPEPLDAVLDALQERADAHDHFEFWTFPHADVALTRTMDRTEDAPRRPGRTRAYVSDVVVDNGAFRALSEVARRFPGTIPRLNRFASAVASQRERVDWSYRIFASDRLVRFEEMEYSVPREHAVEAVRRARAALERHPVSFPIELRFSAADDALLSPAHGARQRLRGRARLPGHGLRGAVPRGRGRALGARRAPALGQALVPATPGLRPALPALGGLPARPRGARSRRALRQRVGPRRAGMTRMKTFNIFEPSFEYDPEDPDGYHAGMDRFGPKIGATRMGASVYELPPGQALCPYHFESDEEWVIVLEGAVSVRHPEGTDVLGPGDTAAFPIGPAGAHKVFNASEATVRFIMLSTKEREGDPYYAVYPDSNKMLFGNGRERAMVRLGENLDYYDGEVP